MLSRTVPIMSMFQTLIVKVIHLGYRIFPLAVMLTSCITKAINLMAKFDIVMKEQPIYLTFQEGG